MRRDLRYITGFNYWLRSTQGLVLAALNRVDADYWPDRLKPRIVLESRIMLGVYGGIALLIGAGITAPLLLWMGPVVLAQPLVRGWLLAEHAGCAFSPDMYRNSRTTYTNSWMRFLIWNMSYHIEHHAYPGVPFHALPELNRHIRSRLQVQAHGYLRLNRDWLAHL